MPTTWQPVSGEAQALLRLGPEAPDVPAGAGRSSTLTSHVLSNQSRSLAVLGHRCEGETVRVTHEL